MPSASLSRRRRPMHHWLPFLLLIGLADASLVLAYCPALADSLESLVLVDPFPPPPLRPAGAQEIAYETPGIDRPDVVPADKAAVDDDTPVIGVYASGHARAYLLEAFTHGPESHIVNDVLGSVPVSVTHCDISGCTRVFTGGASGQPLALSVGGRMKGRLMLKFEGHLYRQETSEPLKEGAALFPYREYPAKLTDWRAWRQSHPDTDVYMGPVEEATPIEAGGPRKLSHGQSPFRVQHSG
jgi:hypothetical protein